MSLTVGRKGRSPSGKLPPPRGAEEGGGQCRRAERVSADAEKRAGRSLAEMGGGKRGASRVQKRMLVFLEKCSLGALATRICKLTCISSRFFSRS